MLQTLTGFSSQLSLSGVSWYWFATISCKVGHERVAGILSVMVRGSNSDGSEIFHTRPDQPGSPHSLLYNGYRISLPGGINHPPPSSAEVKERIEPYLCSPYGPLWLVGQTLPLPFSCKKLNMDYVQISKRDTSWNAQQIPWSRDFPEKLTRLQLVKKFSKFDVTRRFITAFTTVSPEPIPRLLWPVCKPPKLNNHPMSAVSDCLLNIFAATLHIWRSFLHPQPENAPSRCDRDPLITARNTQK